MLGPLRFASGVGLQDLSVRFKRFRLQASLQDRTKGSCTDEVRPKPVLLLLLLLLLLLPPPGSNKGSSGSISSICIRLSIIRLFGYEFTSLAFGLGFRQGSI